MALEPAWDGPIGGLAGESFDLDAFAAHQFKVGGDAKRAVLILYLECKTQTE